MSNAARRRASNAFNEHDDNGRSQRRRIEEELQELAEVPAGVAVASSPLMDCNDDVLLRIMSFLSYICLNEVEMCSLRCQEIRSHESLNQTRVGTIVFSENTTRDSLDRNLQQHWYEVFTGNKTHLKIVGLELVQHQSWETDRHRLANVMAEVLELDVSCNPEMIDIQQEDSRGRRTAAFTSLLDILPNLREMNVAYLKVNRPQWFDMGSTCPNLERVKWNGCHFTYIINGNGNIIRDCLSLTEICFDGCHFIFNMDRRMFDLVFLGFDRENNTRLLWATCTGLERLSMQNTTWINTDMQNPEQLSQNLLMAVTRAHQKLRWIRSDLAEENVARLRQERNRNNFSEIAFVTD